MRKVLFIIGMFLFFGGLSVFLKWTFTALFFSEKWGGLDEAKNIRFNVYLITVLFFVGTYLVSNNKPED